MKPSQEELDYLRSIRKNEWPTDNLSDADVEELLTELLLEGGTDIWMN